MLLDLNLPDQAGAEVIRGLLTADPSGRRPVISQSARAYHAPFIRL